MTKEQKKIFDFPISSKNTRDNVMGKKRYLKQFLHSQRH